MSHVRSIASLAGILSLSLAGVSVAQLEEAWSITWDGPMGGDDEFKVVRADDGGTLVVGDGSVFSASSRDMVLVRFDGDGVWQWTGAYDGPTGGNDYGAAIHVDAKGVTTVVGYGYSSGIPNTRAHAMRVAPDGTRLWGTTYVVPGSYSNITTDVAVHADGTTYAVGWTTVLGQPSNLLLVKYEADGTPAWSRVYDGPGSTYDSGYQVAVDSAGNAYVTGRAGQASGPDLIALLKYAPDGTLLWDELWGGPDGDAGNGEHLVVLPDDSVVIGGRLNGTSTDVFLAGYSADGVQQWLWTWDGADGLDDVLNDLVLAADGDLYFTGTTDSEATGDDVLTGRMGADGTIGWVDVRVPDAIYPWNDRGLAVAMGPKGGVHVVAQATLATGAGLGGDGPPSETGTLVLRYGADGALEDQLFAARGGFERAIDVAPGGAIVTAGTAFGGGQDGLLSKAEVPFVDCNDNGIHDPDDLDDGTSLDCNGNGVPDECDLADGTSNDCDGNDVPDECQIADEPALDADGSGILDSCEATGDLDGSGDTGLGDLLILLAGWGDCADGAPCPADLDGNGIVDFGDLLVMLAGWD